MAERTLETLPVAPPVLSLDYHLRFVPALIAWHLRPEPQRGGFAPHFQLMVPIVLIAGILLLTLGGALWADDGATVGNVVATLLGAGLLLGLVGLSIVERRAEPLSYARFSPSMFAFCIVLGATIGVFTVRIGGRFDPFAPATAWAILLGTTLAGYCAGLAVGYWWQRLGTVGGTLAVFAWPAMIGMIVTAMVLLSG